MCIAPTCYILDIIGSLFMCPTVSTVGTGNIKAKKRNLVAQCDKEEVPPVTMILAVMCESVDYIYLAQDRDQVTLLMTWYP